MPDVIVSRLASEKDRIIPLTVANARLVLDFSRESALVGKQGDDILFSFTDGTTLTLKNFYKVYSLENMPQFLVNTKVLTGEAFFANLPQCLMPRPFTPCAANDDVRSSNGGMCMSEELKNETLDSTNQDVHDDIADSGVRTCTDNTNLEEDLRTPMHTVDPDDFEPDGFEIHALEADALVANAFEANEFEADKCETEALERHDIAMSDPYTTDEDSAKQTLIHSNTPYLPYTWRLGVRDTFDTLSYAPTPRRKAKEPHIDTQAHQQVKANAPHALLKAGGLGTENPYNFMTSQSIDMRAFMAPSMQMLAVLQKDMWERTEADTLLHKYTHTNKHVDMLPLAHNFDDLESADADYEESYGEEMYGEEMYDEDRLFPLAQDDFFGHAKYNILLSENALLRHHEQADPALFYDITEAFADEYLDVFQLATKNIHSLTSKITLKNEHGIEIVIFGNHTTAENFETTLQHMGSMRTSLATQNPIDFMEADTRDSTDTICAVSAMMPSFHENHHDANHDEDMNILVAQNALALGA